MKLLVAGPRSYNRKAHIDYLLNEHFLWDAKDTVLISGGARGVDTWAEQWAKRRGIPIEQYLPDYDSYPGRVAPIVRNRQMAEVCDQAIIFWDGASSGTMNMMSNLCQKGKEFTVIGIGE